MNEITIKADNGKRETEFKVTDKMIEYAEEYSTELLGLEILNAIDRIKAEKIMEKDLNGRTD